MGTLFAPVPAWRTPETVWQVPHHPGVRLCRLTHPDDVKEWAKYMGHSGGAYTHWVCDQQIWHFLTFIDAEGLPHCTIHAKDSKWFGVQHPDDTLREKTPSLRQGMKLYVPSTQYDHEHPEYGQCDFTLSGHRVLIMAVGHIDNDDFRLVPEEGKLFEQWWDTVEKLQPLYF